ncbi:F-box protein At5g49610-like [Durio zibethinus]|uniref:F-box protein At5g49610-like n=1 Tax=Durio zibethinus TaxID=66656 RepID=A0A6P5ZI30_DURZI|nr:F-box protein At5g49610-like [Durio zibethinus]
MAVCNVCSDVLFEILSRVELKTLRKCRLLSRECNSLTYESSFIRLHCQRTKTIAGYFIQSLRSNWYHSTFLSIDNPGLDPMLSLDFLPGRRPVKILATADQGLMFCVSQFPENHYYICKPSTKQWETIPSPNPGYFTRKIAMVELRSDPLLFKIVRLSDGENRDSESETELDYDYKHFQCEIFNSNTWAWKRLNDLMLSYDEYFNTKPAISAYGGLHWLTSNKDKNNILSFHENKESWELVPLPDSLCQIDYKYSVNLAQYEGKLALICVRCDSDLLELWIIKDFYGKKLWTKRFTVNLQAFKEEIGHSSAYSFYNKDTLLMTEAFGTIFYNFKNGQYDRLKLGSKHMNIESAFFVQTNYEPIQLRRPKKDFLFSIVPAPIFLVFCPHKEGQRVNRGNLFDMILLAVEVLMLVSF